MGVPAPTAQPAQTTEKANLMSLKPAEVAAYYKAGSITKDDTERYIYRKELEKKSIHDYSPQEVSKGYKLGVFQKGQVADYIDKRENPISYHIKDIFNSGVKGVSDAIDETVQTADWFAKNTSVQALALKGAVSLFGDEKAKQAEDKASSTVRKGPIQDTYKPKTTAGDITKGVTQFVTGFLPASKATQGLNLAKEGTKLVGKELAKSKAKKAFVQGSTAGAITDFTVFDEHDARLSDLIQSTPSLANPVTDYLKSNPGDTLLEGKLKNAIEGLGLGTATEALFMGVKQVKNLKLAKHGEDMGDVATEIDAKFPTPEAPKPKGKKKGKAEDPVTGDPMVDPNVSKVEPSVTQADSILDPNASKVVDNIAQEAQTPKPDGHTPGALYDESTTLKLSTTLDQAQAQDLANAIIGRHGATDTLEDPGILSQKHMDMMGDTNTVKDIIILTSKTLDTKVVSHVDTAAAAKEMGVDEAQLIRTAQKMAGDTENAHAVITATRELMLKYGNALAAQTDELVKRIDSATHPITTAERLQFVDNLKMFQSIQGTLKGITTNTARAVSAGRIHVNGRAFDIADMSGEELSSLIGRGQKDGFAEIDDIIKMFHEQKTPEARARMAGKTHGKGLSGIVEYYQSSLLSSPTTHLTNMVSNAANIAIDELAGLVTSPTAASKYRIKGLYRGLLDGLVLAKKAFKEEAPQLDKVHKMSNENGDIFGNFSIGGTKGKVIRSLSFRPMLAIDEVFKNITYRAELTSIAYEDAVKRIGLTDAKEIEAYVNKVVTAPNKATHMKALEYARKMTFQEEFQPKGTTFDTPLEGTEATRMKIGAGIDNVFSHAQRMLNDNQVGMIGKILVLPFYQTPVNLLKAAGRMTPGINMLSKRYMEDIKAGGFRASRARAKTAIGTGILALGYHLYSNGDMVGGIDKDQQKIAADNGVIPYSVFDKENGKMTLSQLLKMDPFVTHLGLGADFAKAVEEYHLNDDAEMKDIGCAIALSTANMTVNKAFMKSLKETIDAFSEGGDGFWKLMANKASGFVPFSSALGLTQELTDEYQRNVLDLRDALYSKIHSEKVMKRYNALGEPKVRPGRNFIAGQQTNVSTDPILREMLNVKANITQPSDTINVHGVELELNKEQYTRYNELIAQPSPHHPSLKEVLTRIINDPRYSKLPSDQDRAAKITNTISNYREHARLRLVSEFHELNDKAGTREGAKNSILHVQAIDRSVKKAQHWLDSLNGESPTQQSTNQQTLEGLPQ